MIHLSLDVMTLDDSTSFDISDLLRAGDLLPGWYEDWVLAERDRLRQLRLHTLEFLCERLTRIGMYAAAVQAGLAVVREDPLRESAHRVLVGAYAAEGNYGEAIRQYRLFRQLLQAELGLKPSAKMQELARTLNIPVE
jgi:DNA-binding SARP family transcriptional activator